MNNERIELHVEHAVSVENTVYIKGYTENTMFPSYYKTGYKSPELLTELLKDERVFLASGSTTSKKYLVIIDEQNLRIVAPLRYLEITEEEMVEVLL